MKRYTIPLIALLVMLALFAGSVMSSAEPTEDEAWQADILKLMNPASAPTTTSVRFDQKPASAEAGSRTYAQELVSSNGDMLCVEFHFALDGIELGEGQWATITQWLKELVLSSVQNVQADSESLAHVVADAYRARRAAAQPGETGLPAWAFPQLLLQEVTATVPYYPELKLDVNGAATQRLQRKLILLGYLNDKADGYYGANTRAAVMQLEEYVRQLEQDAIDARYGPAPVATEGAAANDAVDASDGAVAAMSVDVGASAEAASVASNAIAARPSPVTPVDGVADHLLQAYLFSDDFRVCRRALQTGDEGSDVGRVQTRLVRMGYTTDAADGIYGGGTARSVRVFQYYNGLDQTGVADAATQALLFSEKAKAPDNAMLTLGSSGDTVAKLQKRLRVLGFASIAVDGGYGTSTKTGVETLQAYMREMEQEALAASASTTNGGLTVEVNGVADPILLDAFYSEQFPAIPAAMSSGSQGRDVVRLQRRLACLEYYYSALDGQYGSGTAAAVTAFQRRNGLAETGTADRNTLSVLFDENAKKALKPYVLKVSVDDQRVYAYAPDSNGDYTELVRTMKCSTGRSGSPTPKGTFQDGTGPGARWHYFTKFNCWAQYAYYIQGDIMFHSVLYNQKEGKVTQSSVNHLGSRASHGCVRLSVEDAKWIWNNCPTNTKVIVY